MFPSVFKYELPDIRTGEIEKGSVQGAQDTFPPHAHETATPGHTSRTVSVNSADVCQTPAYESTLIG